jgi:hypothetical protein
MSWNHFLRWGRKSFFGHLILSELFFSLPALAFFAMLLDSEGTPIHDWVSAVFAVMLGGFVFALVMWFAISYPISKRKASNPEHRADPPA